MIMLECILVFCTFPCLICAFVHGFCIRPKPLQNIFVWDTNFSVFMDVGYNILQCGIQTEKQLDIASFAKKKTEIKRDLYPTFAFLGKS